MALLRPRNKGVLAAAVMTVAATQAVADPSLEDAVKATYLYKFAPFVNWPAGALHGGVFNLCVSGNDPVIALIPDAIAGQKVGDASIAVHHLADGEAPMNCNILYVANPVAGAATLGAARNKPVLTVTEEGSGDQSIIQLRIIDHHVRFDVDEKLAADSGLSVSSKLLSLAHAVTPASQGKP